MDRKTFEYMNERTEKYKGLKDKKIKAEHSLKALETVNLKYFTSGNSYVDIPENIRSDVKAIAKEIYENYIKDLEKEMEEI